MVKALAESGLVNYEPYTGVSLTRAGRKLATRVLRRHRLVELFLVQVMGLSWDEVHEEAELLEHVVSDRLIDRMPHLNGPFAVQMRHEVGVSHTVTRTTDRPCSRDTS